MTNLTCTDNFKTGQTRYLATLLQALITVFESSSFQTQS
uniref:Uncharacterized protein n=1 Tax=Anguilla anguilla TaxID=7936 RepID=A0A0E9Q844_ANGAN